MGKGQTILDAGLGEHQYTISSIFNTFLSRNIKKKCLKMAAPPHPALLLLWRFFTRGVCPIGPWVLLHDVVDLRFRDGFVF